MSDYVVRFTGQDNLSGTINKVNKELGSVGEGASKLDKIMDKFNRIDQSAAPLKKKLRDLQQIMAQMNLDGLTGTDQFTTIAEKAGQLKDAIGDASAAVTSIFIITSFFFSVTLIQSLISIIVSFLILNFCTWHCC